MADFQEILKKYWGYDNFRPLQEDIIRSVFNKKDTLGLMPTGGGKSLTFQVPTLAMEGLSIVVTPLIALMKDQVDNLKKQGIRALAVYSGMNRQEIITAYENAIFGDFKFLYISPERLNTTLFIQKLQFMKVALLVVDEAHCISQWGYDFRPSYLKISKIRDLLPEHTPILALTATATKETIKDIQKQLHFTHSNVFSTSFQRENLIYSVKETSCKEKDILSILSKIKGSGLIYVRSRKKTKEISDFLNANGISSDFFHAGLSSSEKTKKQDNWKTNETRIMVCTNAFGMGIDKPDVRFVIHIDLPNSLEEYFQEAGRAGRDGEKAYALTLYQKADIAKLNSRVQNEFPEIEFIKKVYVNLAYFYQVAMGFDMGGYRNFNIYQFAKNYKMPVTQIHNALKILTLAGYLDYQDEVDNKSRLIINIRREELYEYNIHENASAVLHCLLRAYTGLFSQYVTIDENKISEITKLSRQDVYEALKYLSKLNIIDFVPTQKEPMIAYQIPRVESKYLILSKEVYKNRLGRFEKKINFVKDYVSQSMMCRVQFLLSYLGEKKIEACGKCDICKSRNNDNDLSKEQRNELENKIHNFLEEKTKCGIEDIIQKMHPYDEKQIIDMLRLLMDDNKITYTNFEFSLPINENL